MVRNRSLFQDSLSGPLLDFHGHLLAGAALGQIATLGPVATLFRTNFKRTHRDRDNKAYDK